MPADLGPYQPRSYDLLRPDELLRGQRGEYRVLGLIGRGSKGAVYRVERQRDRAILALKELNLSLDTSLNEINEMRQLFIQNAEQLAALNHPGLPTVVDLFGHAGRPEMVLEFVAGDTLEMRLRTAGGPLQQAEALEYAAQIARILQYLHTRQPPIIYRDVKPFNF